MNYTYSNELYHYGVLGMKWGHRKSPDYQYKSFGTRHNERKAARALAKSKSATDAATRRKYAEKAARYQRRALRSATLDKREQAYAKNTTVGGNIAARLLTGGSVGGKAYQQYLAMQGETRTLAGASKSKDSKDRARASTAHAVAIAGSMVAGRAGSTLVKAIYIRSGEEEAIKNKK